MIQSNPQTISGLAPFNEERFKASMAYLSAKYSVALDIYKLVKLHTLIDVLHVIRHGKPIIGGELAAWKFGPVAPKAYFAVHRWIQERDRLGSEPQPFRVLDPTDAGKYERFIVESREAVHDDEFSPSELSTIEEAWRLIGHLSFKECKRFFHEPHTFIGAVWLKAWNRRQDSPMDWRDLIAAYEEKHGGDHRIAKLVVEL